MMTLSARTRRWRALCALVPLVATALVVTGAPLAGRAATASVSLGAAANYAALAGETITSVGATVVTGNLGLSPGSAITGFPPGRVTGRTDLANPAAHQAKTDLAAAFTSAGGRTPTEPGLSDITGRTFGAGVYTGGALMNSGTVTLRGGPDSVFIFSAASTLILAVDSRIVLTGGVDPCNVFWRVGSSATLEVNSTVAGTILASASISAKTGARVAGRLLARSGAVTMDRTTVGGCSGATPAPMPPPRPTPPPATTPPVTPPPTPTPVPTRPPSPSAPPLPSPTRPPGTGTGSPSPSPGGPQPTAGPTPVPSTGSTAGPNPNPHPGGEGPGSEGPGPVDPSGGPLGDSPRDAGGGIGPIEPKSAIPPSHWKPRHTHPPGGWRTVGWPIPHPSPNQAPMPPRISASGMQLAMTGADPFPAMVFGAVLLFAGRSMMLLARKELEPVCPHPARHEPRPRPHPHPRPRKKPDAEVEPPALRFIDRSGMFQPPVR